MSTDRPIIIGASTAGLFAAYLLAKDQVPVQVYDACETLGDPSRTLIATGKLAEVLGFDPKETILNKVHQIDLVSAGRSVSVELRDPDLVIERRDLVRLLARKAMGRGAKITLGHRFLGFHEERGALIVSLENVATGALISVRTTVLVGADGVLSKVAKSADRDSRDCVSLFQMRVALPRKQASNGSVKVWFDRKRTPFFYWLIPESRSEAVIGLISENGKSAAGDLQEFVESQGCEPLELQANRVALHDPFQRSSRTIAGSRVLLIGDAGGHVKTTTVGGLVAGLRGAKAAVEEITGTAPYNRAIKPLSRELDLHHMLRALLNGFSNEDYDLLLGLLDSRTKEVLAAHSRDEFKDAFFRLLRTQPRMSLLAARSFARTRDLRAWLRLASTSVLYRGN